MKHNALVSVLVCLALVAPAVGAGEKGEHDDRHHHGPVTNNTSVTNVDDGGSTRDSVLGLLGWGVVLCTGVWLFTEHTCFDPFRSPVPTDDNPDKVTPDNLSGGTLLETTISGGGP